MAISEGLLGKNYAGLAGLLLAAATRTGDPATRQDDHGHTPGSILAKAMPGLAAGGENLGEGAPAGLPGAHRTATTELHLL